MLSTENSQRRFVRQNRHPPRLRKALSRSPAPPEVQPPWGSKSARPAESYKQPRPCRHLGQAIFRSNRLLCLRLSSGGLFFRPAGRGGTQAAVDRRREVRSEERRVGKGRELGGNR